MGSPNISLGLHLQEATGPVHVCVIDLTAQWSERPSGWPETPFTQTCALGLHLQAVIGYQTPCESVSRIKEL